MLAFLLIFSFILSYALTKDIFHPAVIMNALWMVLVNLYVHTEHPLFPLSDKFCVALFFWVIPFTCISLLFGRKYSLKKNIVSSSKDRAYVYNLLYPYFICFSIVYVFSLLYYAGGSLVNIRHFLVGYDFPPFLKMLMYVSNFMFVYVMYGILNYKQISKKKLVSIFIAYLVVSIFNSSKTTFLALFVALIYVYRILFGKLKVKTVILLSLGILALIVFMVVNRGDSGMFVHSSNPILDYLYIYLLSPLPAFDMLLHSNNVLDSGTVGSGTFSFFYTIFNALGANYKIAELGTWVEVPLLTNVFTVMRGYYLDWGMMGIFVMSLLMGLIWGILYSLQQKMLRVYILFYSVTVGYLFFQSFGDYFWHNMSMTLQYFIAALFLTKYQKRSKIYTIPNKGNNSNLNID